MDINWLAQLKYAESFSLQTKPQHQRDSTLCFTCRARLIDRWWCIGGLIAISNGIVWYVARRFVDDEDCERRQSLLFKLPTSDLLSMELVEMLMYVYVSWWAYTQRRNTMQATRSRVMTTAQFDLIIFIAFHICVVQSLYALEKIIQIVCIMMWTSGTCVCAQCLFAVLYDRCHFNC
jgi:hypothetical protein